MRRFLIIITTLIPIAGWAQAGVDTTTTTTQTGDDVVSISMDKLFSIQSQLKDAEQKVADLQNQLAKVQSLYETATTRIKNDSIKIDSLVAKTKEMSKMTVSLENSDIYLFNIASNFLYIPYEDYSINEIAIPVCESIRNKELIEQNSVKYNLLKEYKNHINQLLSFLEQSKVKKQVNKPNPFDKNKSDANNLISELKKQDFYIQYLKYEDWPNTYLGKTIKRVEKLLKNPNEEEIETIINQLTNCINPK